MSKKCIKCGADVENNVNFCEFCGSNEFEMPIAPVFVAPANENTYSYNELSNNFNQQDLPQQNTPTPPPDKKLSKSLITLIIILSVIILGVVVFLVGNFTGLWESIGESNKESTSDVSKDDDSYEGSTKDDKKDNKDDVTEKVTDKEEATTLPNNKEEATTLPGSSGSILPVPGIPGVPNLPANPSSPGGSGSSGNSGSSSSANTYIKGQINNGVYENKLLGLKFTNTSTWPMANSSTISSMESAGNYVGYYSEKQASGIIPGMFSITISELGDYDIATEEDVLNTIIGEMEAAFGDLGSSEELSQYVDISVSSIYTLNIAGKEYKTIDLKISMMGITYGMRVAVKYIDNYAACIMCTGTQADIDSAFNAITKLN